MAMPMIQDELSEREIQILGLLHEGLSNKEIAAQTGLTLYTVKWYLKQVYSKLHVSNRTQAANTALEMGLLDTKDSVQKNPGMTSNLPEMLTPFFGRDTELRQLTDLLRNEASRLITIHGAGGMGKTRLALEVAHQMQQDFVDGVFFVSLARFDGDPLEAVLTTLQLSDDSRDDILGELVAYFNDKQCLIVLDNFEHLSKDALRITALLERTQHLQMIITSREILRVQSETVFPLEGLNTRQDAGSIESNGAYQLYVQRARTGYNDFDPTEAEKAMIEGICDLLGGMPLAIEIAAGWAALLSVEDTYQRLQSSLDLLTSDEQDRPLRQQSIRATFDYSWDLLPEKTQGVLLALGVFDSSGFALQAAEDVAGANPMILKQLLDASLIQRASQNRFVFHPLIHQYVTERLESDSEFHQQMRDRHAAFYFDFVMRHIKAFREELDLNVIKSFLYETINLDIAWRYSLQQGRYDWLEAAVEVGYLCEAISLWKETDLLFATTLRYVPEERRILRGRLLAFRAVFAFRFYDLESMQHYARESWEMLSGTDYIWDAASAMAFLALGESFWGDDTVWQDILNDIDVFLVRDDLPPHAAARGLIESARLACLFFSGFTEEALPILETLNMPGWHEVNLHLPEYYIQMDKLAEARAALENLYTSALDNHYYKSAVYATFYLEMLESKPENLVYNIAQSLIELARISGHYPIIAKLAYYYGTLLMIREHRRWAKLLFLGVLHMLHDLGEKQLMYQYALRIGDNLIRFQPEGTNVILNTLIADPDCSKQIQEDAMRLLSEHVELSHHAVDGVFLDVIGGVLLEN
jgi:predicted ATPase/DNA-binding CsgD family transcriptional regulator